MLTPNLPRFVRVGDKTSVAASISNMTGKLQAGTVNMILFDPMTEKVISTQKQKFTVEAGKTIGVSFMFTVSDKYEILGCRMIADSGTFQRWRTTIGSGTQQQRTFGRDTADACTWRRNSHFLARQFVQPA